MELLQEFFLACLWAFLACVAFGLVYNIHGVGILICGLGGALGWFVYLAVQLLPVGSIVAAFAAAATLSAVKPNFSNNLPAGAIFMMSANSAAAAGAIPNGVPGCPLRAASTCSAARTRTERISSSM